MTSTDTRPPLKVVAREPRVLHLRPEVPRVEERGDGDDAAVTEADGAPAVHQLAVVRLLPEGGKLPQHLERLRRVLCCVRIVGQTREDQRGARRFGPPHGSSVPPLVSRSGLIPRA